MGAGGEFFALSDDQLRRLLSGELAHAGFLRAGGPEQPREAYTQAAQVWYELSQVLQAEAACGAQQSDKIPDLVGYSNAQQVQDTAAKLASLAQGEVRKRCDGALMEASVDDVLAAVQGLTAFYQRAAGNKDAVLFRVG